MVYAFRVFVAAAICIGIADAAHGQTLLESSAEARFQLDFHVPDAALMAMLPPDRSLGFQVRRCHRAFDRVLNGHLAKDGLSSGFWYFLRALWMENGATQKRLSQLTNVTEPTAVTVLSAMDRLGLIRRTRNVAASKSSNSSSGHWRIDRPSSTVSSFPSSTLEANCCQSVVKAAAVAKVVIPAK